MPPAPSLMADDAEAAILKLLTYCQTNDSTALANAC
jgi:hypothetical protein